MDDALKYYDLAVIQAGKAFAENSVNVAEALVARGKLLLTVQTEKKRRAVATSCVL